jgi:hypothetical protein
MDLNASEEGLFDSVVARIKAQRYDLTNQHRF